jgi:hypothetical protein
MNNPALSHAKTAGCRPGALPHRSTRANARFPARRRKGPARRKKLPVKCKKAPCYGIENPLLIPPDVNGNSEVASGKTGLAASDPGLFSILSGRSKSSSFERVAPISIEACLFFLFQETDSC